MGEAVPGIAPQERRRAGAAWLCALLACIFAIPAFAQTTAKPPLPTSYTDLLGNAHEIAPKPIQTYAISLCDVFVTDMGEASPEPATRAAIKHQLPLASQAGVASLRKWMHGRSRDEARALQKAVSSWSNHMEEMITTDEADMTSIRSFLTTCYARAKTFSLNYEKP